MTQTSRLVLEVDSRSAEQRVNETRQALQKLEAEGLKTPGAMSAAAESIGKVGDNAKSTTPQLSVAERQFKMLSSAAVGLGGALAAAFSVQKIAQASQQYADLTNRLRLVTEGSAQLARAQDDVFRAAQNSRQSLEVTASVYQRIAQNGKALGISMAEVAKITETVTKSVAMSGASAASADAALVQFGQALASGTLRGEELNSILEQTPALAQTIARGLGVTIGQLRAMGAEGQLTAEKVIGALSGQKDAVDKLAATMQVTASQAMTAFANSLTSTIGKLDQATGASNTFANSVLSVSRALDGFNSGEFLDFFREDKQSVAGFNNDIAVTISRIRELTAARSKLNPGDAKDSVLFNFKFYNREEIDAEIAGLNKKVTDTRASIGLLKKGADDLGAQLPKGEAAIGGLSAAAKGYVDSQSKALAKLQDNNDAVKEANRFIAEHTKLTEAEKAAILSVAYATNAQTKANKDAAAATRDANKAYQENAGQKMLDNARQQYAVLVQQGALIDEQAVGAKTLGSEAKKLLELEQQIAQLKEKGSLTTAQKQILAMGELNIAQQKQNAALEKENELRKIANAEAAKLLTFTESINDKLALSQQGLSNQLAGIGLGQEGRKRLQDDLKIRQDYQKDMDKLQAQFNSGDLSKELYDKETGMLEDALGQRLRMQEDYYDQLEKAQSDWTNGANAAWQDYVYEAGDIAGQTYDLFDNAFRGMEDSLVDFVTGGKLSFKDLADSIIADIARIIIKTQVVTPLLNSLFGGGAGAGGGGGIASLFSGSSSNGSGGGGLFSGLAGLGQNLLSAWNTITGVGSSVASGYASGGVSGALSGGASYYGNMLSNIGSTLSNGFSSLVSTFTGATAAQTAATIGAQGVTSAVLSGAVTEGATAIGAQFTTGVATTTAATYAAAEAGAAATAASLGGQISAAMSSAAAMWPLAVIMGMYQSGKLYDAGVRPDASEMFASGGSTALGKASMIPQTLQSKAFEITDGINSKLVGGKLAAIISGSTLHQAVWGAVGKKLFGGAWETKDGGISLGVENGEFDPQQYIYQKKKGGLFSSSKKRTRYSDLDAETESALGAAYNDKLLNSMGLFSALGVQLSESVFDGLNVAATKISTQGKTPEAIQEELDKWFSGLGDSAVSAINAATNSGLENYNFETLTTFVNDLYSVNDSFDMLGLKLYDVSVSTGFMAEQLISMAGGLEALKAGESSFFENFYTDTEKADYALSTVNKQFEAMGVKLPGTREAYRDMVEALDRTTESGRQMYVTLTSLSGNAAQAYSILEQRADAAAAAVQAMSEQLIGVAGNAQSALQRAISAQQKATTEAYNARVTSLNDMVSTATESVSGLTSVGNDLGAALKALRGDSDDAVKMLRAQAQATLQSALATARSGGSLSGFTGLSDALDTVSNNNTDLYGSMEDFARDQGRTANVVAELNGINGKQLTTAEKSLKGLETQIELAKAAYDAQMAQFDSQLAFAQAQMDALNGVDASVMGVTAAINAMNASVVAALGAIAGKATAGTPTNNGTLVESVYQSLLGREADAGGKAYWEGQLASGAISYNQLAQAIANAAREKGQAVIAPGYATGGLISGPGTGTSDSIIARLSNGEYVLTADAVRTYGTGMLDQMNAGQLPAFAGGGAIRLVGTSSSADVAGSSYVGSTKSAASMAVSRNEQGVIDAINALQNYLYMITKYSEQTASGVRRQNEMQEAA
jgi:lambda family phage tail tape measure protein